MNRILHSNNPANPIIHGFKIKRQQSLFIRKWTERYRSFGLDIQAYLKLEIMPIKSLSRERERWVSIKDSDNLVVIDHNSPKCKQAKEKKHEKTCQKIYINK